MKKALLSMILCTSVFLSTSNLAALPNIHLTQSLQEADHQNCNFLQDKKGNIIRKEGNKFAIMSEDGNEYTAPVETGYQVGDYIYHSDPVNRSVFITGHVNES